MEDKEEFKIVKIRNARVKYARVIRPGKAYDSSLPDEWSINIYPTDEDRDTLMAHGVNPKEDKEGNEYWLAKRSTKTKAGKDAKPVPVVNGRKEPVSEDIGNGSVCNINVTMFPWTKGRQKGVKLYLNAVQVVNLVPYNSGGGADDFDEIDMPEAEKF